MRWLPWLLPIALATVARGEGWRDVGSLVEAPEDPFFEELRFGGQLHLQSAYLDGEAGGREFGYRRGIEWRRARLNGRARLLRGLELKAHLNMVDDDGNRGGGVEWDYQSIFSAAARLELTELWEIEGLDGLSLSCGKRKLSELSEEIETSSNRMLTVERSAWASQVAPFRGGTSITGAWVDATRGLDRFGLGFFTTEVSPEFGDWDGGWLATASWRRDLAGACGWDRATLVVSAGWQEAGARDTLYAPWEWIVAPWLRVEEGPWGLRVSAALGENADRLPARGGAFYGLVVMPSRWLIEERLRVVGRLTWSGSEGARGVVLNSRYAREAGLPANEGIAALALGRGDHHLACYGGLEWWPVPETWSVLAGLEWERLESREVEVYEGVTAWFTMRVMF